MMQSNDADIHRTLDHGRTLYGPGWSCVDSFEELDEDEYGDEEEEYIVLDLGSAMDNRTLQTEATYQLIGMDTAMPFLRIGEHVFEGRIAPLIGDEVLFDVLRDEDEETTYYLPTLKTSQRVEMRGITLEHRGTTVHRAQPQPERKVASAIPRSLFPSRPRRKGRPPKEVEGEQEAGPSTPARAPLPMPEITPGATPTPTSRRASGRTRHAIAIATLTDLADIAHAGGLGELRLDISPDATADLLAAVSAVRGGKPWTPSCKLSKAQEERLLRNLPSSGPGSRGGKRLRGVKHVYAGAGRPRTKKMGVGQDGEGLAEEFLGPGAGGGEAEDDGGEGEGGEEDGGAAMQGVEGEAGPSGATDADGMDVDVTVDEDEVLRGLDELGEDELRAIREAM